MLITLAKDSQENTRGREKQSDENSVGGRALKNSRYEEVMSQRTML